MFLSVTRVSKSLSEFEPFGLIKLKKARRAA